MKRVRIPKFRYKPRHRGGWFRGYDGPAKPEPEKHTGATLDSPNPKDEVAAAGEDPLIVARAELVHDAQTDVNEKADYFASTHAAFASILTRVDDVAERCREQIAPVFDGVFAQITEKWGIGREQLDAWYWDTLWLEVKAEKSARDLVLAA